MAEGGYGYNRSSWRNRWRGQVPRQSSRVCAFFAQGDCYYGSRCRFRHVIERPLFGDNTGRGEQNACATQPRVARERRPEHSYEKSDTEPDSLSGACSKSSEEDLGLGSLRVDSPENVPSEAQETNTDLTNDSNEAGNEASNSSSRNSQEGCSFSSQLCETSARTSADASSEGRGTKDDPESDSRKEKAVKGGQEERNVLLALQRSKDKACGICFDVIMEKSEAGRKFGILPNCNHCFCLGCIRQWRRANDFDNEITRACPECRVSSDFVCPSFYWVESKEEKEKLIKDYKDVLSEKNCKYFLTRRGRCPFGEKCFYKHAKTLATSGRRPFRRRRRNVDVEITVSRLIYLWDVLVQDYDSDLFVDPETGVSILSDSDDSIYRFPSSGDSSD